MASMSTYSQPSRYTFCIAEHEEESPWESLAVSRGYGPDEDVITAVMVENPHIIFNDVDRDPKRLLVSHMDNMAAMGSWPIWVRSDVVLILSPEHARLCAQGRLLPRGRAFLRLRERGAHRARNAAAPGGRINPTGGGPIRWTGTMRFLHPRRERAGGFAPHRRRRQRAARRRDARLERREPGRKPGVTAV